MIGNSTADHSHRLAIAVMEGLHLPMFQATHGDIFLVHWHHMMPIPYLIWTVKWLVKQVRGLC